MAKIPKAAFAGFISLTMASPALAADMANITFANFGQTTSSNSFVYARAGDTNTISLTDDIRFNILDLGAVGSYLTTGNLFASSTSAFFLNGLQFEQTGFSGGISFTSLAGNFLTATFTNATFSFDGDGGAASLISSDPVSPITYTSDFINVSGFSSRDFAFNLTGATPNFAVGDDGLGQPFTANLGGSFAGAGAVPEPASWAMLIIGFGLTGVAARRRRYSQISITA